MRLSDFPLNRSDVLADVERVGGGLSFSLRSTCLAVFSLLHTLRVILSCYTLRVPPLLVPLMCFESCVVHEYLFNLFTRLCNLFGFLPLPLEDYHSALPPPRVLAI